METNHVRVLRELSRKSPQTSMELADAVGAWRHTTLHRGAIRVNAILGVERERGHVSREGFADSGYHGIRAFLWKITPAGQAWLDEGSWKLRGTMAAERKARWAMTTAHSNALIEYLDREARAHGWDMDTPAPQRKTAIQEMHEMGCTLQSMGDIFGISREYVRLILQGYMMRNGTKLPVGSSGLTRRKGHLAWIEKENS
jgi:hypothetical protein